jgi:FkbM family methyltransferase
MAEAYDMLADESSRREFCSQIRWRVLLDPQILPLLANSKDMYFPAELFRISEREVLVDCGAFDGDSIRTFLERSAGRFQHIYAFEADSANLEALTNYRDSLIPEVRERITILPYAVGRENGTVRFAAEGFVGSRVANSGRTQDVPCRTLDSALAKVEPTLIKMDIEGSELDALRGAQQTTRRSRPVFAVCAYHKCDHLWIIPKLLRAANPDYRIFLRRYAEDCWETVYYAVPPERLPTAI